MVNCMLVGGVWGEELGAGGGGVVTGAGVDTGVSDGMERTGVDDGRGGREWGRTGVEDGEHTGSDGVRVALGEHWEVREGAEFLAVSGGGAMVTG